jgi:hypothetical protein
MTICKNCGAEVNNIYCGHCGQKAEPERITLSYIWHGLVHFFTHAEHGFFYTSRQMILAPGRSVKEFIDGKRKYHQTPVSFFLIWNAIYILLLWFVRKLFGENNVVDFTEYFGPAEKTQFAISHLNLVLFFLLPFQALYLYLLLFLRQYNYFEAFVAILYGVGTLLLWQIVFVLLAVPVYLFSGFSINIRWSDVFKALYMGWLLIDLVKLMPVKYKMARVLAMVFLIFGTFTAWRVYVYPSVAELFF